MRRPQQVDEKIVEQDLEPDVGIEQRCNTARHKLDRIDSRVPSVRLQTLIRRVERVSTLVRIHKDAKAKVEAVDEGLGAHQGFPEIHGSRHLAQEFDEDDGAAKAIDGGHDGCDRDGKGYVGKDAGGGRDGVVGENAE